MKYKLEMYGWELEASGHSLTDVQVEDIQNLMEENGVEELWEVRYDIEDEGIIQDLYSPDMFQISKGLDNNTLWFSIKDENDKEVLSFEESDMVEIDDMLGDDFFNLSYPGYSAIPGQINDWGGDNEVVGNVLVIFDESKGGIAEFEHIESNEIPKAKDFAIQYGSIETPDAEWGFVNKVFYKGKELEVYDHLDNTGKASTVEIYCKGGIIIK